MVFDIILDSSADTFAMIIFWIFFVAVIFNLIDKLFNNQITYYIENNEKLQPLLGSTVGLIPGCGGGIFIFSLYKKGKVKFSGLVAASISSIGALAFFLMTSQWVMYLLIISVQWLVGVVVGYLIQLSKKDKLFESTVEEQVVEKKKVSESFALLNTTILPIFFALFMVAFSFVGVAISLTPNGEEWIEGMFAVKLMIFIFILIVSIWYISRFALKKLNYNVSQTYKFKESKHNKINEGVNDYLYDPIADSLMVIVVVWFVLLIFSFIFGYTNFDQIFLDFISQSSGVAVLIIIASLVALIPTCGIQIVFATALVASFGVSGALSFDSEYFWIIFLPLFAQSFVTVGDFSVPLFVEEKSSWLKINTINFVLSVGFTYIIYGIVVAAGVI